MRIVCECDLADARVRRDQCDLRLLLVRSLLAVSLSLLFSWGGNHLKIK